MARQIKNAALVQNVVDISLLGTADLGYWQNALKAEQLEPLEHEGMARVLVIAADAKFMGLRFRELSFAVFARDVSGLTNHSGSFLLRAFNSRRSFAWIERVMFKTPYYYGVLEIEADPPRVVLTQQDSFFKMRFGEASLDLQQASRVAGWHGPVFLPSVMGVSPAKRKLFFAHVRGPTIEIPYETGRDIFELPNTAEPPFQALRESNFSPTQWSIRPAAMHVKSKTYSRGDCPPFVAESFPE